MINNPPPFKGLNIRLPTRIPIRGRGFINQGSTLQYSVGQKGSCPNHGFWLWGGMRSFILTFHELGMKEFQRTLKLLSWAVKGVL